MGGDMPLLQTFQPYGYSHRLYLNEGATNCQKRNVTCTG